VLCTAARASAAVHGINGGGLVQRGSGVALQGDEIVEGHGVAEAGGVDQRHEDVAASTVERLEEKRVLPMEDRLFQGGLSDVA
jgi:hypothetical protein